MQTLVNEASLRLGIITDSAAHLGALVSMVKMTEHQLVCSVSTDSYSLPLNPEVDAWFVRIEDHNERAETLLKWLDDNDILAVIDDASDTRSPSDPHAAEWFNNKIRECVLADKEMAAPVKVPERVWVLAASAGGPEAVFAFLSELGTAAAKNAYIYAQHIDEQAIAPLFESVKRCSDMHVRYCEDGVVIEAGTVYLVSPEREFDIQAGRRFIETDAHWKGSYKPSIDQVVSKVARAFVNKSAVIVFSGMGDDGSGAVRLVHAAGGTVLTQSLEDCAVDSMPREANMTGCVDFSGSVKALARKVEFGQT